MMNKEVMESAKSWYLSSNQNETSPGVAAEAFEQATAIFSAELTKDDRKPGVVSRASSLQDVQDAVAVAKTKYESTKANEKTSKWLGKLAVRLNYYGNIFDVLAQHHPEYVALAWGSMKFLIMAFVNHDSVITFLAKTLTEISHALPRVELATLLFPTERMKNAVAELYAYLLRFFMRAYDWYSESKIRHLIHSISRPVEIRYKDLVETISQCSQNIDRLALAASHAEQRIIHQKLDLVLSRWNQTDKRIDDIKEQLITSQAITSSGLLDTNTRLSDLQLSTIMQSLATSCLQDPIKSYQHCLSMRRQRSRATQIRKRNPLAKSPKLREWANSCQSGLRILKGTLASRFITKDTSVDLLELLQGAEIPAIWVLRTTPDISSANGTASPIDVIKSLIFQAIRLNTNLQNERSITLSCMRFHAALGEEDWFDLLGSVLAGITSTMYMIVDLESLDSNLAPLSASFSWQRAFLRLLQELEHRGCKVNLKILLVAYGSVISVGPDSGIDGTYIIPVDQMPRDTPRRTYRMMQKRPRAGLSRVDRNFSAS